MHTTFNYRKQRWNHKPISLRRINKRKKDALKGNNEHENKDKVKPKKKEICTKNISVVK
jgi:hypothetical protein